MNKSLRTAAAAVLLTTSAAMAYESPDLANHDPYGLLDNYRFTEADLKQFDKVHVTTATTPARTANTLGQQTDTGPLFQWTGQNGRIWSVSIGDDRDRGDLRINAPLIRAEPVLGDTIQPSNEILAIQVSSIPEPSSLAMITIGLFLICPNRSEKGRKKP